MWSSAPIASRLHDLVPDGAQQQGGRLGGIRHVVDDQDAHPRSLALFSHGVNLRAFCARDPELLLTMHCSIGAGHEYV